MLHIYYLLLLVITAVGSVSATLYGPQLVTRIKQYLTRFKRTPKPVIDPSTLVALTQRIEDIEKRLDKRQINYRQAMRQEIKNVLLELKNEQ
jgi:purine nucleoside phosphorylase